MIALGETEIFITTFKDWKTKIIRYWTDPEEAREYVRKGTHGWDVVEGKIE